MKNKKRGFWNSTWKELYLCSYIFSTIAIVFSLFDKMLLNHYALNPNGTGYRLYISCYFVIVLATMDVPFYICNYIYLIKKNPVKKVRRFWIGFLPVIIAFLGSWWIVLFFKG